jgi:hypothetical protein
MLSGMVSIPTNLGGETTEVLAFLFGHGGLTGESSLTSTQPTQRDGVFILLSEYHAVSYSKPRYKAQPFPVRHPVRHPCPPLSYRIRLLLRLSRFLFLTAAKKLLDNASAGMVR